MSRMPMDPDAIRALAALLHETGLTEIEIADKDSRIRVARGLATTEISVPSSRPAAAPLVREPEPVAEDALHPGTVISPMVGVAYLSPDPGAPPFVTVGQRVTAGQTLLLIEAMKTFNQIRAPKAGTVARVLVANGVPVEYGEPLMVLD